MADQNEMTPEQATLYYDVYVPAFVEKSAELGRKFDSEEALNTGLETAALVKQATANRDGGVLKEANTRLKKMLGFEAKEAEQARETAVKTASTNAAQNPKVRQAILAGVIGK